MGVEISSRKLYELYQASQVMQFKIMPTKQLQILVFNQRNWNKLDNCIVESFWVPVRDKIFQQIAYAIEDKQMLEFLVLSKKLFVLKNWAGERQGEKLEDKVGGKLWEKKFTVECKIQDLKFFKGTHIFKFMKYYLTISLAF